jgi:hypothetical protein
MRIESNRSVMVFIRCSTLSHKPLLIFQELTPGIWQAEDEYEITKYIDWHTRHPHCVTPRAKDAPGKVIGEIMIDEENPELVYSKTPNKKLTYFPEFQPTTLGES